MFTWSRKSGSDRTLGSLPGMAIKNASRKARLLPYQIFVILFFLPLTCCGVAASYLASFFGSKGNLAHRCLTQWARLSLALAGLRVEIAGKERLDPKGTYIFMPNHASFLDILLLLAYVPCDFRFIIKEEFFSVPLLGRTLERSGDIPMDRKNPWKALRSLRRSAELLKEGISIVVFPEGTRTSTGEIQEFKTALFILPVRTRIPVVPVLIEGTFDALKRGSVLLNPLPLKLIFHEPIEADSCALKNRDIYANKVHQVLSMRSYRETPSQAVERNA